MHIHILGICGTFMAGVAELAIELGHQVTGSDSGVYPPMSTFLRARGIDVHDGYDAEQLNPAPDLVLVGNALSRGNEAVEYILNEHLNYLSAPQWLASEILPTRHVIAIAGTHGKTTTTSILAWILEQCGLEPGYLIGGIAQDFEQPAKLGGGRYFIIEADEYDTAFFDKRSKFVHYHPDTLVLNNLEFDHADIFPNLEAIKQQFHHLLRTVPATGSVIYQAADPAIADVLARGCWSRQKSFGFNSSAECRIVEYDETGVEKFKLRVAGETPIAARSPLLGRHNALNATAAACAAADVGVPLHDAIAALASFGGVKRRLEIIGVINQVTVYDDFAHHPTAIGATLDALRSAIGGARIICIVEPRSNTMRLGIHAPQIASALAQANEIFIFGARDISWDPQFLVDELGVKCRVCATVDAIVDFVTQIARPGDHIVIMSNGAFANIHTRLLNALGRGPNG
ncbi:MAG: UDP-N-acetylmuramate:L-alanyl-gamma-D-glutamyl-meso-diaminopimelate ligase [Proteobacteria bacterium]|nr:MAG: UDP-N-acetylmuramate:L-alanyl-gamma-D-glutamyl-meso-diaminopimelate ligase [Pseudomonadota bacterium]